MELKILNLGEKRGHFPGESPSCHQEKSTKEGRVQLQAAGDDAVTKGSHPQPEALLPKRAGPYPGPTAQHSPREQQELSPHRRFPEFGPRSEIQRAAPAAYRKRCSSPQTPGAGQQFWQSIRRGYSLLAFVIIEEKSLKYKFKRRKWLLCMRSNCLCKKSQWDFILFFYYVPKYIFTEQRLQSTGGRREGNKNTLYINMYDM